MSFREMACQATAALLDSEQLTNELAREIQRDLATVTPLANVANCVDHMERISTLDAIVYASIHGLGAITDAGATSDDSPIDYASVDWNVVLRKLNRAYDQAVAVMKMPHGPARDKALDEFNAMLDNEAKRNKKPSVRIAAIVSRNTRSDLIGSIFAALMLPALDQASTYEDRTNSMLSLTRLAAALAVYRTEYGAYPETLNDLTPAVLDKLPADLFHAKPFDYRRFDEGFLIYTAGANGRDDGGSNEQLSIFEGRSVHNLGETEADALLEKIPDGADDYSVRLPGLPFKVPESSTPSGESK
jgi:hypothetical protein